MLARMRDARKNESGFTLIELLIVIVILGILAGIVVFSVSGITDRGAKAACKADVASVTVASEAYYAKNASYASGIDNPAPPAVDTTTLVGGGFLHSAPATAEGIALTAAGAVTHTCAF